MALFSLPLSLRDIVLGQSLLVDCCLVYLAWWCVAFRPGVAARAVTVRATMVALHGGFAGRMASD